MKLEEVINRINEKLKKKGMSYQDLSQKMMYQDNWYSKVQLRVKGGREIWYGTIENICSEVGLDLRVMEARRAARITKCLRMDAKKLEKLAEAHTADDLYDIAEHLLEAAELIG